MTFKGVVYTIGKKVVHSACEYGQHATLIPPHVEYDTVVRYVACVQDTSLIVYYHNNEKHITNIIHQCITEMRDETSAHEAVKSYEYWTGVLEMFRRNLKKATSVIKNNYRKLGLRVISLSPSDNSFINAALNSIQ